MIRSKINIPIDFGFVTNKSVDGYLLAYTYQDGIFHLIKNSGEVEYSINNRGEGPKEYSENVSFGNIYDDKLVFMDMRNIYFYEFNGDWIKSIPYDNLEGGGSIGIPNSDLLFLDNNRFIIPNTNLSNIKRIPNHLSLLDTMPIWIEYSFSDTSGRYIKSDEGLMDTTGVLYSKSKFVDYGSIMWLQDENLYQIPQISNTIYRYKFGGSLYPIEAMNLDIPDFKAPKGLDVESLTVDNYQLFNKNSSMNSLSTYAVPVDNGGLFGIYSPGLLESEYDNSKLKKFYGVYFDKNFSKGYKIELPKHSGSNSFWKKVSYLGEKKFLFVFENEIERDFYWGYVFELKKEGNTVD